LEVSGPWTFYLLLAEWLMADVRQPHGAWRKTQGAGRTAHGAGLPGPSLALMQSERSVIRVTSDSTIESGSDLLATERPIELRLGGVPIAVLMSSPGMEDELALGFALTEGILLHPSELAGCERIGDGDRLELRLREGVTVDPERFRRNSYTTSSCGVCGKASIDAVLVASPALPPGPRLTPARLTGFAEHLRTTQPGFTATGGLHAAAIFDPDGTHLASAEDIGRHNAVDKAIGALARTRWPLGEVVLQVSGRVSFEVAQKAAVAGIPVLAGVSAASSLAAELADETGLTLVGFSREGGFVVYSGAQRIIGL
jgi:FdhD protein